MSATYPRAAGLTIGRTVGWNALACAAMLCANLTAAEPPRSIVPSRWEAMPATDQLQPSLLDEIIASSPFRNAFAPSATTDPDETDYDLRGQGPAWNWPRFWASSEVLVWWRRGMRFPALVTDNAPNPNVLYGDDRVGGHAQAGGRHTLGFWFTPEKVLGMEATFVGLGRAKTLFSVGGGPGVVVRPFNLNGVPNVLLINSPPDPLGTVTVTTTSDIYGGNASFRRLVRGDARSRLDFLFGYQIWRIEESATIQHNFTSGGNVFQGTDRFLTENEFHGVDLGLSEVIAENG